MEQEAISRYKGSLGTTHPVTPFDLCKFGSCNSLWMCGVFFLHLRLNFISLGMFRNIKKEQNNIKWPVAVGKLGLFHSFSASWDLWFQVKVIGFSFSL